MSLTTSVAAHGASLHLLKLCLQGLNLGMGLLQILVKAVTLSNELLLPLPEALLLDLDLLGKALSECFFLFLVFGVVELPRARFAELTGLHLLRAVGLVVKLLGGVDEVKHVSANEDGAQLLEVTVVFVLNLGNTPRVLTTFHDSAITSLDVFLGSDDGERHRGHQAACVLGGSFIVFLNRGLVDLDALSLNNGSNL